MRTTVDLPDPLFRRVKSAAALRGSSLKEFIREALQQAVAGGRPVPRQRVRLPLVRSKHPGALRLTNADIEDHLADINVWVALLLESAGYRGFLQLNDHPR